MRGTIGAVVLRVHEHTHNIHTNLLSSTIPNSDSHVTHKVHHTTPRCNHTTQDIHSHCRSLLEGTLDAALICLVAQVVVTWHVPSILLFFLTTRFISNGLSLSSKSLVFRSYHRNLNGHLRPFRSSSAPVHVCLPANFDIQLYLFLLSLLFKARLFPSP